MIFGGATQGRVSRDPSSWFDVTQSWTYAYWGKFTANATIGSIGWLFGPIDYTGPYIGTYIPPGTTTITAFMDDGAGQGYQEIAGISLGVNAAAYIAMRYTASTTRVELLVNSVVVGTLVYNLTNMSNVVLETMLNDMGSDLISECGYARRWQALLTNSELAIESASITAVRTTNLLSDTPLQASIDLTAHNNTMTQWSATGTVVTDTSDPLISVIAGPPTNISPATALEVNLDSVFFQDVNTAGVATDVWYKYQSVSADDVLGIIGFGDLTTYKPIVEVFKSLADANADIEYEIDGTSIETPQNRGGIFPVPVSSLPFFYFKIHRNGAVAASTLQFSLLRALSLPVPVGSIGINHDNTQGWPLTLLDQSTGYPIHYVRDFIGGNGGCTLPDGTTIFTNSTTHECEVIDPQLNIIATIHPISAVFASGNLLDKFIIATSTNPTTTKIIDPDGTIDPIDYILTANIGTAFALSRDNSIIYFVDGGANKPVKRWDVATNTALTDLAAGISGYTCCLNEIIVLDDGSILVNYFRTTPSKDIKVVNYSAAGATLHTYDFGPFTEFAGNQNRIAGALDNLNQFWSWIKFTDDNSTGQFRRVRVSDGAILTYFTTIEYDFGQYQGIPTSTPIRFGNPDSCPFWVTRVALFPPTPPPPTPGTGCVNSLADLPVAGRAGCIPLI